MAADAFEHWKIEYNSGVPVYRQIINLVSAAVVSGALKPGEQLPTIRALHQRLQINPNTVAKAYRELELKGIIASERGSGSFVNAPPAPPNAREKRVKLNSIYARLLTEAASEGVTESELASFMKERNA